MNRIRFKPSPAMLVAILALMIALGGTAYASSLITGKQIKNGSVTGADIKNGSLTGADLRNHSVGVGDLQPSAVRALAGRRGPAGGFDPGRLVYVTSPEGFASPGGISNRVAAACPSGGRVVGGGFWTGADVDVYASAPDATRTEWVVYGSGTGAIPVPTGIYAYAICAIG